MNFDLMNTASLILAVLAWAVPIGMRRTENGVKKLSRGTLYLSMALSIAAIALFAAMLFGAAGSIGFAQALAETEKISTAAFVMALIMLVITIMMIMPEKKK